MALRFEELEEFLADFGGFHGVRGTVLTIPDFYRRHREMRQLFVS
jgi:hypothetical protein